ncbi:uncharacterized protein EV420DRAFT_1268062 [Desarmillaria tabescens]|uniref:Uncharacterized protein n=1 Tax=Armillaria tabescens TaxID=1929756 RepID=A0AA39KFF6_ARMTA|nr:uncharacterized protein EV420DRAFT_1268062 [Desarmillaria tabescens]KAK0460192.1 hypothetical protein EV420DRAFT_1268062 [Desarmillaria tabescens]
MAKDPWRTDESASSLWFEQALNATVYIGAMAYGTQLAIAFLAVYHVINSKTKKYVWQSITYVGILVLLSTIYTACNIHSNEMAWIDERGYPGGPLQYQIEQSYTTTILVANVAAISITFLADICMLWRCWIVYRGLWIAVALPALLLLSSTAMGILLVLQLALPGVVIWGASIAKFSIPYWALSITFTLLVTFMIVARVLSMRRGIQKLGPECEKLYTGIAAMLVECALPYALISFVFIILYGLRTTASNLFVPLMIMVEAMTPQLIMIRVACGHGLSSEAVAAASGQMSAMEFQSVFSDTERSDSPMTTIREVVHAKEGAGPGSESSFEELSKPFPS